MFGLGFASGLIISGMIFYIVFKNVIQKYIKISTIKSKLKEIRVERKKGLYTPKFSANPYTCEFECIEESDDMVKIKVLNIKFQKSADFRHNYTFKLLLDNRWFEKTNKDIKWLDKVIIGKMEKRKRVLKNLLKNIEENE